MDKIQYLEGIDNPDKTPNWKNRAKFIVESAKMSGLSLEQVSAMGLDFRPELQKLVEEIWNDYGTTV